MIESANAISDLHQVMRSRDLSASAYPTPGFGLLVAATVHVLLSIFDWESCRPSLGQRSSLEYLRQDMEGINHTGQRWSLAVHWVGPLYSVPRFRTISRQGLILTLSSIFSDSPDIALL